MEVHFTQEQEAQLAQIARREGKADAGLEQFCGLGRFMSQSASSRPPVASHPPLASQGCLAKSISTISELFRSRSNTICLPSAVMSKVRMVAGFVRWVN
jgi:hypothetical protein